MILTFLGMRIIWRESLHHRYLKQSLRVGNVHQGDFKDIVFSVSCHNKCLNTVFSELQSAPGHNPQAQTLT